MNEAMLQQLAKAIVDQTVLQSWPFYTLLLALTFVGATCGAYLRAHSAKRGEVAATKADADTIIEHLQKTTEATKAVELSLSRGDWLQRERNVLQRVKLEQLVTAAMSLASWTSRAVEKTVVGDEYEAPSSLDEFKMLSLLYFPELKQETSNVVIVLHEAMLKMLPMRHGLREIQHEWDLVRTQQDTRQLEQLLIRRVQFQNEHRDAVYESAVRVEKAVMTLAESAFRLMERLTEQPTS